MKGTPRGEGGDGAPVESVIEESFRFAGRLFIFNFRGAGILTFRSFITGTGNHLGKILHGKRGRSGKVLRGGMS